MGKTFTLQLRVGFMAPSFRYQLRAMKLKYDSKKMSHFESLTDSVLTLEINDIISEKTASVAIKKITTKALAHVRKVNNLKLIKNVKASTNTI